MVLAFRMILGFDTLCLKYINLAQKYLQNIFFVFTSYDINFLCNHYIYTNYVSRESEQST